MIYRQLGKTGMDVSVIGFGGEWLVGVSEAETCHVINEVIENDMNYMDIFMPQPDVRSNIGTALKGSATNVRAGTPLHSV